VTRVREGKLAVLTRRERGRERKESWGRVPGGTWGWMSEGMEVGREEGEGVVEGGEGRREGRVGVCLGAMWGSGTGAVWRVGMVKRSSGTGWWMSRRGGGAGGGGGLGRWATGKTVEVCGRV
jgi:hypothetical protein